MSPEAPTVCGLACRCKCVCDFLSLYGTRVMNLGPVFIINSHVHLKTVQTSRSAACCFLFHFSANSILTEIKRFVSFATDEPKQSCRAQTNPLFLSLTLCLTNTYTHTYSESHTRTHDWRGGGWILEQEVCNYRGQRGR